MAKLLGNSKLSSMKTRKHLRYHPAGFWLRRHYRETPRHSLFVSVRLRPFVCHSVFTSGENRSSTQAYPAPGEASGSVLNGYPAPGSGSFYLAGSTYPPPQADPPFTVTVEPQMHLPIVSMPAYSPKKGLGLGAAHLYPYDYTKLNVSWIYNWDLKPYKFDGSSPISEYEAWDLLTGGVEFVPMIYCGYEIQTALNYLGADWDGYLMFLNESWTRRWPDCDPLTTEEAAQTFLDIREAFPDAKLIGPNIHHNSYDDELPPIELHEWRNKVHEITQGTYPDVAGYAIHTYTGNPLQNLRYIDRLQADLITWQQQEGRTEPFELWVTEFGYCGKYGDPSDGIAAQDISDTVDELEVRDYVTRYAYYANRTHPKNISATGECFLDESENHFLFVELYGADPHDPENPKDVCRRFEDQTGNPNCNDLVYEIFASYTLTNPTHYDLTQKGVAYK
jgi:hypothetical protein